MRSIVKNATGATISTGAAPTPFDSLASKRASQPGSDSDSDSDSGSGSGSGDHGDADGGAAAGAGAAVAPADAGGAYAADAQRWEAVQRRDARADGRFYYSVRSTGVYCKPSCASRLALRSNVQFHASGADAEAAGFRPCQRCKPEQPPLAERHAALAARVCALIDAAETAPDLQELAEASGMSRFHLHRVFKAQTGITPKAYATARRGRRVQDGLRAEASVTQAIYAAGFNSSARFYADAPARLGMTPGAYRSGGDGSAIRFAIAACSLGALLVAATDKGICAILLGDDPDVLARDLQDRFPKAELFGAEADFEHTVASVVALVEAPAIGLALPLDVRGTAFQQRVWQALRDVAPGRTVSYAELAVLAGVPNGARAVAGACAANPLAVAIPCHRVVRNDGALSGYRWGVERKEALLKREAGEVGDPSDCDG